ncbi:MAG: hypothetical protein O2787_09780, partial [Cyanobacteria bacterium]|nr:hypothetical protein [Cyanobacteriota bacterium]
NALRRLEIDAVAGIRTNGFSRNTCYDCPTSRFIRPTHPSPLSHAANSFWRLTPSSSSAAACSSLVFFRSSVTGVSPMGVRNPQAAFFSLGANPRRHLKQQLYGGLL